MDSRILSALILLAACSAPQPDAGETASPASETDEVAHTTALTPGEHSWTTADGVEIPLTVAGEGEVTVVLVHCWMCDRTFWSEQLGPLAERYRTLSLDLPGHGEAGTERAQWTVAGYGEDVAGLLEHFELDDVVLVGHSMGGPVSLKAAALSGDRVRGIVAVDTLHQPEFDFSAEGAQEFVTAFDADFVGTCGEFVSQMFVEEGVEEVVQRVRGRSCAPERAPVGAALMKDFATIDMPAWLSESGVPIRAVNAAAPHPTHVDVARKYADFDVVLVEGVGHYLHMTRPEEFNPLLFEAISEVLAASADAS